MIRRALVVLGLGLALAAYALPQETKGTGAASQSGEGDSYLGWKWANFAVLAVGLGYLIGKHVPPLFRKQSGEIQGALADAAKMKREAAVYAAGIEARLSSLENEIRQLREIAHSDMTVESDRVRRETEHHLQRIREQSVQEVALMTRAAKDELRKYSAELAIGLAGQRIRARLNPETQESLVNGFLSDLHHRNAPRTASN